MTRFIKLFISVVLVVWLAWFQKFVIQEILTAQTFSTARLLIGLALIVLACMIMVVLFAISEIETWQFERLVYDGDNKLAAGELELAREVYVKAQQINNRWMNSKPARLFILNKLLAAYRELGDQASCVDIEHRLRAIESAPNFMRIEKRILQENLVSEKDAISSSIKRPANYIIATTFAVSLLLIGWYYAPPPVDFPIINDLFIRLTGSILIIFTVGESLCGKAHGGAGPTAYWNRTPYWYSFRAGCFLFFGITMELRFDRLMTAKGYWQIPADIQTWFIMIAGILLCSSVCYVLAYCKSEDGN